MEEKFAYGVDYGWVSQLEAEGVTWVDEKGEKIDPLQAAINFGVDSVRLRVFVNPPKEAYWDKMEDVTCMLGYCDRQSVLSMSKRIKAAGLRLMLTIHYSDHFADPDFQDIPEAWKNEDFAGMKKRLAGHTKDILESLLAEGIEPDWIQVGNEINHGILWPVGSLKENPKQLVELINAGYDVCKEIFPECPVILHMAGLPMPDWYDPFFENFFSRGGKTDIIGFSYYPYWYQRMGSGYTGHDSQEMYREMERIYLKYKKPIMLCEIGESEEEPEKTRKLLKDAIEMIRALPDGSGIGIFYWEPEVGAAFLPDHYPLGAARQTGDKTLCFTDALKGYLDAK